MGSSIGRIAAVNTFGYGIALLAAFVQAPFLLAHLGDQRYGIWALIGLVTGYYGLLDLGVRGAVGYFVAGARARDDRAELAEITSSAIAFLSVVGVGVALSAFVGVPLFLRVFAVPADHVVECRQAMEIAALTVALGLPLDVFGGVLNGARRADLSSLTETSSRLAVVALIFVMIPRRPGLDTLAAINLGGRLLIWSVNVFNARRVEARAASRWHAVRVARMREILRYGVNSLLGNVAVTLIERIDSVLIATALGPAMVTIYVMGQQLSTYAAGIVKAITLSLTPFFSDLSARRDDDAARRLLLSSTRVASMVSLLVSAGLYGFGTAFLTLWVGPQFTTGDGLMRSDVVLLVLVLAYLPRYLFSAGYQYLFGARKHHFLAWAQLVEGSVNALASLLLVRSLGLFGIAVATLLPALVVHGYVLPRFISRTAGVSLSYYFEQTVVPWLPMTASVLIVASMYTWFGAVAWLSFSLAVMVAVVVAVTVAWFTALTDSERAWVLARMAPANGVRA